MNDIFIYTMAQFLKDHIRETIIAFALEEFAKRGFSGASMTEIAEHAGVSTGNIYRYFKNKKHLFETAMSASFVKTFLKKIRQRVHAFPIGKQPNEIANNSPYSVISQELLQFTIENRLRVIILLEGAKDTIYENFANKLQIELAETAINALKLKKLYNDFEMIFALINDIYGNFLHSLCTVLRRYSDESVIKSAIAVCSSYHLGGLAMIAA